MDSKEVEITEAAFDLILLLDRVEADEQVILTRNGVPVARLSPIKPPLKNESRDMLEASSLFRMFSTIHSRRKSRNTSTATARIETEAARYFELKRRRRASTTF